MSSFSIKADVKGMIFKMDVKASSREMARKTLIRIGNSMVFKMSEYTIPHDWKEELTDSLGWVMSDGTSSNSKYPLDVPKSPNSVDVGSALPYAWFREHGAGPHRTNEGHEEFMANLREWFDDKVGGDDYYFYNIVRKIREGQDAVPFAEPAFNLYGDTIAFGSAAVEMRRLWGL